MSYAEPNPPASICYRTINQAFRSCLVATIRLVCNGEGLPTSAAGAAGTYYRIEWLIKARAAYLASKRQSEWSAYRAKLMQTHGRKYKLMEMLKQRDLA